MGYLRVVVTKISDTDSYREEGFVWVGVSEVSWRGGCRSALKLTSNLRGCSVTRHPPAIRRGPPFSALSPPSRSYHPKFPQPSKTKPPDGDKAFETCASGEHFR